LSKVKSGSSLPRENPIVGGTSIDNSVKISKVSDQNTAESALGSGRALNLA